MNTYYVIDIFVDDKIFDDFGEFSDLDSAKEQLTKLKTESPDWDFRIRKVTEEYI